MTQVAFAGGQAVGDVAQAVDRAQLKKQHRHQLAPAGEVFGVAFGIMLPNGGIEVGAWDQLQDLGKMLHTMDKSVSSSDGQVLDKPNLSERRSPTSDIKITAANLLSWTRVICLNSSFLTCFFCILTMETKLNCIFQRETPATPGRQSMLTGLDVYFRNLIVGG